MNVIDTLPEQLNVAGYFLDRRAAAGDADRPAYVYRGRTITYRELRELAARTGNALRDLGVRADDRVLVVCLDAPEFLGAFWGAIAIGALPVPVSTLMRSADYRFFLDDSGARAAVVSAALLDEVAPALAATPDLEATLVAGGEPHRSAGGGSVRSGERGSAPVAGTGAPRRLVSFEDAVARARPTLESAPTGRDAPAFWLYSSGSTGRPKGVVHRHRDMVVCYETFAREVLRLTPDDRIFSAAKLFFAYGLGNTGYFPLGAGASAVLSPERPTAERVLETIARERATLFFGVPTLYASMLGVPDLAVRWDLSSLRLCVSAGEALPADLQRRWRERVGVEIVDGLGTTETLHVFLANRPGTSRPGSSGTPVPGYDVQIVGDDGRPVARGEIGNLRVRGASTMAGYWNQPAKTTQVLADGWLETGDKCRQDGDGTYWFCGRADDMLKVGGIWVSPFEVEATLVEHPAVLEAAVVGREDDDGLVKPEAFVVLRDSRARSDALAAELRRFVKEKLAPYKYPRWVAFVDELPKTATGKVQRFKLRRR